jgi:hypothetical protein
MPTLSQGDIFQAAPRVHLAIVFRHVGFNEMRPRWDEFSAGQRSLSQINDPFTGIGGRPVEWAPGRWIWFVAEDENHGMSDAALVSVLDSVILWASKARIASVATNGIANVDHGRNTADNRRSDEHRARFLRDYATRVEEGYGLKVELISLNDVFTRIANDA